MEYAVEIAVLASAPLTEETMFAVAAVGGVAEGRPGGHDHRRAGSALGGAAASWSLSATHRPVGGHPLAPLRRGSFSKCRVVTPATSAAAEPEHEQ